VQAEIRLINESVTRAVEARPIPGRRSVNRSCITLCIHHGGFMKPENTLKISDISYYENVDNVFQKAFVSIQCNCALCANNLEITVSSKDNGEVKEEAFCTKCDMKLRSKSHTLQ
jgi:hypothetical protein